MNVSGGELASLAQGLANQYRQQRGLRSGEQNHIPAACQIDNLLRNCINVEFGKGDAPADGPQQNGRDQKMPDRQRWPPPRPEKIDQGDAQPDPAATFETPQQQAERQCQQHRHQTAETPCPTGSCTALQANGGDERQRYQRADQVTFKAADEKEWQQCEQQPQAEKTRFRFTTARPQRVKGNEAPGQRQCGQADDGICRDAHGLTRFKFVVGSARKLRSKVIADVEEPDHRQCDSHRNQESV